jgi:hypothetical protein
MAFQLDRSGHFNLSPAVLSSSKTRAKVTFPSIEANGTKRAESFTRPDFYQLSRSGFSFNNQSQRVKVERTLR